MYRKLIVVCLVLLAATVCGAAGANDVPRDIKEKIKKAVVREYKEMSRKKVKEQFGGDVDVEVSKSGLEIVGRTKIGGKPVYYVKGEIQSMHIVTRSFRADDGTDFRKGDAFKLHDFLKCEVRELSKGRFEVRNLEYSVFKPDIQ
ncbi:MAG: hypothetical protein M0Z60_12895 [Nitrospiraceae bacterium]|nr:hypothetical protein [Nitrospiraceae bacterium]